MLEKRVADVDKTISNFIQALEAYVHVDEVILFGSYGRGTPRDYSDIDLAVVSPDFEGGTERDYLLVGRIARNIHPLLEPIPYARKDFYNHEPGDFIDEIMKTGRRIIGKSAVSKAP